MLIAQRWILARLRDQTFFELGPLNAAIRILLDELNDRPMKKLGVSRRVLYEQLDRPALRPLPAARYVLAQWKRCSVNIDYHVAVEHHVYSVPYQLVREQVEVRYTTNTVEVFHRDKRIASHRRRYDRQPSTVAEHMPSAHRASTAPAGSTGRSSPSGAKYPADAKREIVSNWWSYEELRRLGAELDMSAASLTRGGGPVRIRGQVSRRYRGGPTVDARPNRKRHWRKDGGIAWQMSRRCRTIGSL